MILPQARLIKQSADSKYQSLCLKKPLLFQNEKIMQGFFNDFLYFDFEVVRRY